MFTSFLRQGNVAGARHDDMHAYTCRKEEIAVDRFLDSIRQLNYGQKESRREIFDVWDSI